MPVPGATVSVTGIWRTAPPATLTEPDPDPLTLVSLQPPLYADRAAATGRMRQSNLTRIATDNKSLLDDVVAGANVIRLSNGRNLHTRPVLLLDALNPDVAEYLAISRIAEGSTETEPVLVTLAHPVAYPHRRDAVVRQVSPASPGRDRLLAVVAVRGDSCVLLNGRSLTGLTSANEVEISGGPAADEYHQLRRFSVTSDAEGYYRLPPLSRVAQLDVEARFGTLPPVTLEKFRPDYSRRENHLDFIFA